MDAGGIVFTLPGGGGVRGTPCGGITEADEGVDGVLEVPDVLGEAVTRPGGGG